MTGLIYKDFLALKGHLSTYVVFFVIYGGLCIAGVFSPSVLAGMVVLISIITPMTTVTSDDISRWNRFAVASPRLPPGGGGGQVPVHPADGAAERRAGGRPAGCSGPGRRPGGRLPAEYLLATLACGGIALLMNAVVLPLLLKFGAEKAHVSIPCCWRLCLRLALGAGGGLHPPLLRHLRGGLPPFHRYAIL